MDQEGMKFINFDRMFGKNNKYSEHAMHRGNINNQISRDRDKRFPTLNNRKNEKPPGKTASVIPNKFANPPVFPTPNETAKENLFFFNNKINFKNPAVNPFLVKEKTINNYFSKHGRYSFSPSKYNILKSNYLVGKWPNVKSQGTLKSITEFQDGKQQQKMSMVPSFQNPTNGRTYPSFPVPGRTNDLVVLVGNEKYEELKLKTEKAKREGKTFSISNNSNGASVVRQALLRRGWMERYSLPEDRGSIHEHFIPAPDKEAHVASKLLKNLPVKFIWTDTSVNWTLVPTGVLINRIPLSGKSLSTKTGLLKYLQSQVWTYEDGIAAVKYPRTFSIQDESDLKHFAANYRITACANMLKKFYSGIVDSNLDILTENPLTPSLSIKHIDFAIERLCEYLGTFEHAYIDKWNLSVVSQAEWDEFLLSYYEFIYENKQIENNEKYDIKKLLTSTVACLDKLRIYWPELDYEGVENTWLVKPAAQSCGRGIVILKRLDDIVHNCNRRHPTIVQKYIERPLLIYNTKFDIRQWFLVTRVCPLKIYMYGKCYLRFCSKEFSLNNLHESVHLSNNSIQWRYESLKKPNAKLPKQNMWDSDRFLDYLRTRGLRDKWEEVVIPGIRRSIIGALLASQESMTDRLNSFNLYGADFLLTEDLIPLLIEINSTPCLRNTTDVTARLCPQVLEDTVQVVTTMKQSNANTGYFNMIFDQTMSPELPLLTATAYRNPEMMILASSAQLHIYRSENKDSKEIEAIVEFNQKHSHWEDRTIKYDNLSWYKTRENLELVATIDTNKGGYKMPKVPGDVTPMNEVSYVARERGTIKPSNWMNSCHSWISKKLDEKQNAIDLTTNLKQ